MSTGEADATNDAILTVVTRTETKVDMLVDRDADKETRLRALEGNRWPVGPVTMLLAVVGTVATVAAFVH